MRRARPGLLCSVILFLAGSATPAPAQAPAPCTYDTCALRLQFRFLGGIRVVQGSAAVRVSKAGGFGLHVAPLAEAADTVRMHYEAYRSSMRRTGVFGLLGGVGLGVGFYLAEKNSNENQGAQVALISTGAVFAIISAVNAARGNDHLQQAIWYYNRALPR